MIVQQLIKKKKHCIITIDDTEHQIEFDTMQKYRLYAGQEIERKSFQAMLKDNAYVYYRNLALNQLKKRLTTQELNNYLTTQEAPNGVISQILAECIEKKYLDDLAYAKSFISLKASKMGPKLLKSKLKEKGISDIILNLAFQFYQENNYLVPLAQSKIRQNKQKTKTELFRNLKTYLLNQGFSTEAVDEAISSSMHLYLANEQELLLKAHQKLLNTYQKKYQGYELKQVLTRKLYQKGFTYEQIQSVLS